MPEIAEVQLSADTIIPLLGYTVKRVYESSNNKKVYGNTQLTDTTLTSVTRHGKHLTLTWSDANKKLYSHVHLGMSGTILTDLPKLSKHNHVTLILVHPELDYVYNTVVFNDPRKFGKFITSPTPPSTPSGQDLFSPAFSTKQLYGSLNTTKRGIKNVLLDQQIIAGPGNYLVDESLWCAKIHPLKPADTLSQAEVDKLYYCLLNTALTAYRSGGATLKDWYTDPLNTGSMQNNLNVYSKASLPCPRCNTSVLKSVVAGRSTYFCPTCQQL